MAGNSYGTLIIIGGHEDKDPGSNRIILKEVLKQANGDQVLVVPVASSVPKDMVETYKKAFGDLGVSKVEVLHITSRQEAFKQENIEKLERAGVIFFTGGDQLRITSQIGDSPVYRCLKQLLERGGTVAGTSAGAAAMPETMITGGPSDQALSISALGMAAGLGLISGVVIDSHFSERGRIGRLLGAVAENPKNLGIGIDENTAVVVEGGTSFRVIGEGSVYVVDGASIAYSGLSDSRPEGPISVFGVTLHVLAEDDCFDLTERRAMQPVASKPA